MIDIGAAYYPEQWDLDRVDYDARLMQEAGLDFVRIGEFAWSRLEPRDGDFQLEHMLESIRILGRHGIQVIVSTPGATAPAWLVRSHPEILIRKADGTAARFGVRQHTCYNSPVYRQYLYRIDEKIASALTGFDNIRGFQIDNEIGHTIFGLCHCEACQHAFRQWLKNRYGTIQALNSAWGNGFWSQDYSDWEEIQLGNMDLTEKSSHVLDSIRFHSAVRLDYLKKQIDILRKYHPDAVIATNNLAGLADRHKGYALVDRAGLDCYPTSEKDSSLACPADLYSGMKPGSPFWILETGIGGHLLPGAPHSLRMSAHYWSFIAHGAELLSIFWWRNTLSGYEKTLVGILGANGRPRRRYEQLKNWISEMRSVMSRIDALPLPRQDLAILFDHENHWAYAAGFWKKWAEYENFIQDWHQTGAALHIGTGIIAPDADFSRHRILILASELCISETLAQRLKDFVRSGGILIALGQTGTQDGNSKWLTGDCPHLLQDLFGISIEDCIPVAPPLPMPGQQPDLLDHSVISGTLDGRQFTEAVAGVLVDAENLDAEIPAVFVNTDLAQSPAVTEKKFGLGLAIHINASQINQTTREIILRHAAGQAHLELPDLPPEVERIRRGKITFLINLSHQPRMITGENPDSEILLGQRLENGDINLQPYGVCILKDLQA